MSNSARIAKAAAEVAATDEEKAAKKAAAPPKKRASKPREPKPPVRLKVVWAVGEPNAATPKIFPYAERAAADAEAAKMGKNAMVKPIKVPME
jgi:hypothetical protein